MLSQIQNIVKNFLYNKIVRLKVNKKMKKIKQSIELNDIETFKKESAKIYLNDKNVFSLLKEIIKHKNLNFFEYVMKKYLNPEIFWETNKELVKNNQYDFLKLMIKISRESEPEKAKKNSYANELLFNFLEKDDLFFVDYLVEKENASTENMDESEISVLNECARNNSIKCFDYFLSKGKNVHDFEDLALFTALENKYYDIVSLILNKDSKINNQVAKYFFRYGQKGNTQEISNKQFLKLAKIAESAINQNPILQNALNFQYIKRGYLKELELNLQKGHSPIGDEECDLMGLAIMLRNNAMKTTKLLLDYGGIITEDHKAKLSIDEAQEIEKYPRFSKIKKNLERKLIKKGKTTLNKI